MKKEIIEKLNTFLQQIDEALALGEMGLLKIKEMYETKYSIEDELKAMKNNFEKIESLKIEKAIPTFRNRYKSNGFVQSDEANKQLKYLRQLLLELINAETGSQPVKTVSLPNFRINGSAINLAIEDAKLLLKEKGATSVLDRMHTVLHGYLKIVCNEADIAYSKEATLNQLLKELKLKHPALANRNEHSDEVLKSMANIFDKLNPIRNKSSLAHPNAVLLEPDEAMLVINTINTILCYFDTKFSKHSNLL